MLGLGVGAMYALSAIGVVLIYKSSGVVNISAGAAGMVGAFAWWEASSAVPMIVAILIGVGASTVVGALTFVLAIRPLGHASTLARIVATLGVLVILQSGATLRFGTNAQTPRAILPSGTIRVNSLLIPVSDLWLIGISFVISAGMWALYKWSNFGLATSALSQSPIGLESLGYRANVIGFVNWAIAGALAGISGVFLASMSQVSPSLGTSIIVPVLAAAVVGSMSSFPLVFIGAMVIGAIESVLGFYISTPGISDTVPLVIVAVLLMARGRHMPQRNYVTEKLPRVQAAVMPFRAVSVVAVVASIIIVMWLPVPWVLAVTTTSCAALIVLSIVVVTGFGGQISLAQFALAGVGGLVVAHALSDGVPLLVALALSALAVLPISIIVGLPASRSRGMSLAIATLCLAQVIVSALLNNDSLIGGYDGISLGKLSLFGLDISPERHPQRFSVFVLALLAIACLMVCNIRRGRIGRQLLAVRGNERAAASVGINVVLTKLGAFAYGGMIAALGGALFVLQSPVATFAYFNVFSSIQYVAWAVIGGVGYVAGAVLGGSFQQGSIGTQAVTSIFGSSYYNWIALAGGVILIVNLVQSANGLVPLNIAFARSIRKRLFPNGFIRGGARKRLSAAQLENVLDFEVNLVDEIERSQSAVTLKMMESSEGETHTLEVKDLQVNLGGVRAVDLVSFELRSGEVLGVIGPNGAGKTTLIDAITGFVKVSSGSVTLDGRDITGWSPRRCARAGVSRSFQSLELFDQLTVRENLLTSALPGRSYDWLKDVVWPGHQKLSAEAQRIVSVLSLENSLDRLPDELSFGVRRAVAVARSIAGGPRIVLLDEPAAGLSEVEREHLSVIIKWLAQDLHVAVLLVEHDVALVSRVSDRVLALEMGKNVITGEVENVLADRRVIESYLGIEAELTLDQSK